VSETTAATPDGLDPAPTAETGSPAGGASGADPSGSGGVRNLFVLGGIVAGVLAFSVLARRQADFVGAEVGLGLNTVAYMTWRGDDMVGGNLGDLPALRDAARALRAEGRPLALWLGASQLYAVNHPEEGARTAVSHAQQFAEARDSDLAYVQIASPNTNLHELLAGYLAFRQEGLLPDVLVLGFTYDDLKEPGIRQTALDHIEPPTAELAERIGPAIARIREARLAEDGGGGAGATEDASPVKRTATSGTPQERLEDALVAWLEQAWPAYAERSTLRAAAETSWKMPVTTLAFRVLSRPQTIIPDEMQDWNGAALDAFFALTAADGVPLVIYQAPHRPDMRPFFHRRRDYDAYHDALAARCADAGATWLDLETLVPAELWGMTNNHAPDVFHFREEGHVSLGRAIDDALASGGF
jgi:hypothetical protein